MRPMSAGLMKWAIAAKTRKEVPWTVTISAVIQAAPDAARFAISGLGFAGGTSLMRTCCSRFVQLEILRIALDKANEEAKPSSISTRVSG